MDEITPTLVVGMKRSGTKWLSNELARHPALTAIADDRHFGILETNMFRRLPSKFNLERRDEYFGLIALWSETDFFQHTSVDQEYFYNLDPQPTRGIELFDHLMTQHARNESACRWLQKTSPLDFLKVRDYFESASVVCIKRNLLDTVRSSIGLDRLHDRQPSLIRTVALYVLEEKVIERIRDEENCTFVEFGSFRRHTSEQLRTLLERFDLDPAALGPPPDYERNTSFTGDFSRSDVLDTSDKQRVRHLAALFRSLPFTLLHEIRELLMESPSELVSGTFSRLKPRYPLEDSNP